MALVKCKECGAEISKKAKSCPKCGAPNKASSSGCGILVLLGIGLIVAIAIIGSPSENASPSAPKTASQLRTEKIESGFSAWDGSHKKLTELIKASMNDPKSYDHVKTTYGDYGDYLIVRTEFRGKNAFGGVVLNWWKAKCSLDGQVIELIETGPL